MAHFQTLVIFFLILAKNIILSENVTNREPWIEEAVLDVAFSLRRNKFLANDLRYRSGKSVPLYLQFPDPPLRKPHWQVARRCEKSFIECLKYLSELLKQGSYTREANPFTAHKKLNVTERDAKNTECLRLLAEEDTTIKMFKSPMDKFQWLVSASYYMCWYTYQHEPALAEFKEGCDNFGGCLNEDGVFENGDIRATDLNPFTCALYSFCPDPCCDNRLLTKMEDCGMTPCGENVPCMVKPDENRDWDSMINNEWNVTCPCPDLSTRWDSQSGMCVDVDECLKDDKCNQNENCINFAGGYKCVCTFGFKFNEKTRHCEIDEKIFAKTQPEP